MSQVTESIIAINPPAARKLPPRRWLGVLFWALTVAGLCWLWVRSGSASDVYAVYTRTGDAQGVLSHRGHLAVVFSTFNLGPDAALTAEHIQPTLEQGDELFHGLYTNATVYQPFYTFGYGEGRKGDLTILPAASWSAIVFPHWSAIAVCSLLLLWNTRRFVMRSKERKWRKEGRCLTCGYDLQGNLSDRCPECGTAVSPPE